MTAATTRAPVSLRAARIVALGGMWGITVAAMQSVVLPMADGDWRGLFPFIGATALTWWVVGIGIVLLVDRADRSLDRPWRVAAAIAGGALVLSALASVIFASDELAPGLEMARVFPGGRDPLGAYLYQAWVVMFYGGLYAIAWRFNRRAARTRALLAQAQIARVRSEMALGEAQIAALRGHVDPGLLLRVVEEIERRYAAASPEADRLIALLVAFLRLAMPGLRDATSTLAAEIALAQSYATLLREVDRGAPAWTFAVPADLPDLRFPSLLLLPILDRLALAAHPACAERQVRVQRCGDGASLAFVAGGVAGAAWMGPELDYRLRVALSTLFGEQWMQTCGDGTRDAGLALRIHIPAPAGAPR